MEEQLIIRADATQSTGMGHIMRCLSLARVWQERGGTVVLISCCSSESVKKKIKESGIQLVLMNDSISEDNDLETTCAILSRTCARWLVLDGYQFSSRYHAQIRQTGCRLLVMDDYNHLFDYKVDILVNQSIEAEKIKYNCTDKTIKLFGQQYVFLRKQFLNTPRKKECRADVGKILVTMGGSDDQNISGLVLEAFKYIDSEDLHIRVIVGPGFRRVNKLKHTAARINGLVEFIFNPDKISDHMLWADMGISAAGSTCWELAYMGLPSLLLVIDKNQEMNARTFSCNNSFFSLGRYQDQTTKTIAAGIERMMTDLDFRRQMFEVQQTLVDGRGADRVIEKMIGFEV